MSRRGLASRRGPHIGKGHVAAVNVANSCRVGRSAPPALLEAGRWFEAECPKFSGSLSAPTRAVCDQAFMALSVMHIGAVNQRDSRGGPDGLSTSAADTWRHPLAELLVPEPLHVTPSENLGLGARSSTAKFAVPGSLLILITPPRRIRANIIDGRNKLGPVSFRADQTPDKLLI